MENFVYFGLARAFHVLGVVLWIGGVAFVTTTLIPSLRKMSDSDKRLALFEQLEGKFAFQARIVTLITGLTGFYMLDYMQAWERYQQIQFWWIHLMTTNLAGFHPRLVCSRAADSSPSIQNDGHGKQ